LFARSLIFANQATKLNCLPLPFTCGLLRVGKFTAETKSAPGTHVIGFHDILQKSLVFCEVPGHFKPHSFRIGGATEAKRLGVTDDIIKQWGRWNSNVYLKYIRLNF
jgi:hypothetical protein